MAEFTPQQADLAGVEHLVMGAPEEGLHFRLRERMRLQHLGIHLRIRQGRKFAQHLLVHAVEHGADFGRRRILRCVKRWRRIRAE